MDDIHHTILLTAAGASRRMRGRDKLLERIDGETLLRRQARSACATGASVLVTLQPQPGPRDEALADLDLDIVHVADAKEGMSASLRAAMRAITRDTTHLTVLPADMPDITTEDLLRVMGAAAQTLNQICRATSADGRPGHPVVFPSALFAELARLTGDAGARSVLKSRADSVRFVPLPGQHALTDLDTPEAWELWRKQRNRP